MRAWLGDLLWRFAQWWQPRAVLTVADAPDDAVLETAHALTLRAEQFADGTSGEYKRAWVYGKLRKAHPSASKRAASLAIELTLPLWLLLLWASTAQAQIALVAGQTATSTSGTMWITGSLDETLTLPGAVTVGNTVVAWTGWGDSRRTMSCSHDGNPMSEVGNRGATAANGDMAIEIWARVATTSGSGVVCTIGGNDANATQVFAVAEFSGTAGTLSTSGGAGVTLTNAAEMTSATTHDSGADLTPDTPHNLMLGGLITQAADGGTWTNDGFTMLVSTGIMRIGYLIQSLATAGDWTPTSTNAVTAEIGLVNLDGAAGGGGGGGGCTGGVLLLGAGKCE
jgi:hypothetical protein